MAKDILTEDVDKHEVHHDLESFVWSFVYCIWRKLWESIEHHQDTSAEFQKEKRVFKKLHAQVFSQTEARMIALYRQSESFTITFVRDKGIQNIVKTFMTPTLIGLFNDFRGIVQRCHSYSNQGVPLTHDDFLKVVDKAIWSFEPRVTSDD